jgi:hypothetical protein
MFSDFIAAMKAGLREYRRRRYLSARAKRFNLPF